MELTLIDKKQETPDTISFKFSPEQALSWKAGQFLRYTLNHQNADQRGQNRFFTISAAPFEGFIMLSTRFTPEKGSSFKNVLKDLPIGSKIEASGPGGEFVVDDLSQNYVFIAGGIGITPFRSILKDLDYNKKPINVTLLYANKRGLSGEKLTVYSTGASLTASADKKASNIPFKGELEEIANRNPGLKIHYVIDPQRIDGPYIQKEISNLQSAIFYVSGPEPMVEAMEKILAELEVPKDHIKQDYFPGYEA